jgi:hypothetical protein
MLGRRPRHVCKLLCGFPRSRAAPVERECSDRRQGGSAVRNDGARGSINFGTTPPKVSSVLLRSAARSMRGIDRTRPCV